MLVEVRLNKSPKRRTYVGTRSQEEKTHKDQAGVEDSAQPATNAPLHKEVRPVVRRPHTEIRNTPENETEEGIKEGAHNRQQTREEGNDLGDNPGAKPQTSQNSGPSSPADDGVVAFVAGSLEQTEKDEAGGDGGVQDSEEDDGGDHERE